MDSLFEIDDPQPRAADTASAPGRAPGPQPLATRVRPTSLADFVGQRHLLGPGAALRVAIEQGQAHSMVLYGPPGSGKTTLARIVAAHSGAAFEELSAVQVGRAEVRAVLERARHRRGLGQSTIFFLDEIHRFNKAQQDALLPAVEEGLVTLIGATTENPYFEVNSALLSRTRVYQLQPLDADDIELLLRRALERGEGAQAKVADEAIAFLAARAGGDARTALSALELACETAAARGDTSVSLSEAEDALQRRAINYDRAGDQHYDYISAWIKSTRGSDPDASLYYLATMLEAGEDPRFIARRMVILASEDIGNADPRALQIAVAAAHAVEHVGMPECQFALAQAAIYLSLAPKSNAAARAIWAASAHVREHGAAPAPAALHSGPRPGDPAADEAGYDYPHDRPGHLSPQELMPQGLEGTRFYAPDDAEAQLAAKLDEIRRARGRASGPAPAPDARPDER